MQKEILLFIACSLLMLTESRAADETVCTPAPAQPVNSITQLPDEVQALLQAKGSVADPGGPFNPGDVIDSSHLVPKRRLMWGTAGPDCILLRIEKGGIAHSYGLVQFERVDGQWKLLGKELRLAPPLPASF